MWPLAVTESASRSLQRHSPGRDLLDTGLMHSWTCLHGVATVHKKHFTVLAVQDGTTFDYFIYSQVVQFSGSQPRGLPPPKGHKRDEESRKKKF